MSESVIQRLRRGKLIDGFNLAKLIITPKSCRIISFKPKVLFVAFSSLRIQINITDYILFSISAQL
jgi:hypothetical protein